MNIIELLPATLLIALRLGFPFIQYHWHRRSIGQTDKQR